MPRNPLHTLLRLAVAFIWLWTGLVVLFLSPIEESVALMAPLGLPARPALLLIILVALAEIVLGGLTLINWHVRLWSLIQMGLIVAFTLILTILYPELWFHPFGPISKNVPLLAATIILYSWESQRERERRRVFSFPDESR